MRLTILGGGGFRVPLVFQALADGASPVTEVVLHDVSASRLAAIRAVLEQMAAERPGAPAVRVTTDVDEALAGARFVFSAIRVDGLDGRTVDERVALSCGVLGQETTGPGGIAYGLRTVPVAVHVAERVAAVAPGAWVINFTNPAGMITEAMQEVLGERVVGICDSPVGLVHRAARALGASGDLAVDYVGLNHLGWLRRLRVDGVDRLPELLADDAALAGIEEARLIGADWVRSIGALPNEYLYYYYCTREAIAAITSAPSTRGEFLLGQQEQFYADVAGDPQGAWRRWRQVRDERDASYMAESREASGAGEREAADVAAGGYQQVALELMGALSGGTSRTMILNVRNGSAVPGLPAEAVVEVPCLVGAHGVTPLATAPLPGSMLGLLQQVKAVEQDTIAAARTGSSALALRAFAQHPLVDSVQVAKQLLAGYRAQLPGVAAVLDGDLINQII
ncbi:6-phospho-beta-glucosidase [Pseudonocardia nigra]|uniref:6-phospho-beta-glucosidase n=1 Tax=Pseudonocardia nigra TaxID=1921578 RepID=UPI001C5F4D15|nr:6-phospho-beta-glucosidase [Pseudonocardia nigra]